MAVSIRWDYLFECGVTCGTLTQLVLSGPSSLLAGRKPAMINTIAVASFTLCLMALIRECSPLDVRITSLTLSVVWLQHLGDVGAVLL